MGKEFHSARNSFHIGTNGCRDRLDPVALGAAKIYCRPLSWDVLGLCDTVVDDGFTSLVFRPALE